LILPVPDIIATEIVEDLEAALEQFREIEADLKSRKRQKPAPIRGSPP
jgi:hypothetical protein